jgi:hypothetical protein
MKLIRLSIYVLMTLVFFTGMTSNPALANPMRMLFFGYGLSDGETSSGFVFGASSSGSAETLYTDYGLVAPVNGIGYFFEGSSGSLTTAMASYALFGCDAFGEVVVTWNSTFATDPRPAQLMVTWNTIMNDSAVAVIGTAGGSGRLQISAYSGNALCYPMPEHIDVSYFGSTPPSGLSGQQNFGWLPVGTYYGDDAVNVIVRFQSRSDVSLPAVIGMDCMDELLSTFNFKLWLDDGGNPALTPITTSRAAKEMVILPFLIDLACSYKAEEISW